MKNSISLCLSVLLYAITGKAIAAPDFQQRLIDCMQVSDETQRLVCLEEAGRDAVEAASENDRRNFGLAGRERPVTREEDFGLPPEPEEITEISARIVSVDMKRSPDGRVSQAVRIELDNGQVWRQADADGTQLRKFRDDTTYTAIIKTGLFGSLSMRIEPWGKVIRVRRVE